MEMVTLAHVTLNRVGSASSHGMARHNEVTRVREVPNGSTETLLELVKTVAQENGESRERLHALQHERDAARHSTGQKGAVVFDIQGPTTWHSSPYAVCFVHPALKADGRYYKLEEIAV